MGATKLKKLTAMIFISILIFLTSCSGNNTENSEEKSVQDAKKFIEEMYRDLDLGEIRFGDIYRDYFADESKQIITEKDYISEKNPEFKEIMDKKKSVSSIETNVEKEYDNGISKLSTKLIYSVDGKQTEKNCVDYVMIQNGKCKYLYNGLLSRKVYNMTEENESNKVHAQNAVVYKGVDGITVEMNFQNDTLSIFSFGYEKGAVFSIKTSEGEFSNVLDSPKRLESDGSLKISSKFDGVFGNPLRIEIKNIYTLDVKEQPIESGEGFNYAVLLQ